MKRSLLVALALLVCLSSVGVMFAQDVQTARPMFVVGPNHSNQQPPENPAAQLPQWTYTYKSSKNNQTYNAVMVGTDPSKTNSSTTVTVGIIPVKMVYGPSNGNMTFDPTTPYVSNVSTVQLLQKSPLFSSYIDWVQGGTDLGTNEYIDAYQRGDFWISVQSNTNYHIKLKGVIGPVQTINVAQGQGLVETNPLGGGYKIGTMDINAFDAQLQTFIRNIHQIQPNILPLFVTYNVYLTEGGCCIGGYHDANGIAPGGQTYGMTTVMEQAQNGQAIFAQDISAASHELGEWLMDPFVNTQNACGGIMENGDPLEGKTNYGTYPYKVQGFTFHPQDLVFVTYFGAPANTSVNNFTTFQGENEAICQNGQ